jgi:hypothetical protein
MGEDMEPNNDNSYLHTLSIAGKALAVFNIRWVRIWSQIMITAIYILSLLQVRPWLFLTSDG